MKWNKGYILALLLCNVSFTQPMDWLEQQLTKVVTGVPVDESNITVQTPTPNVPVMKPPAPRVPNTELQNPDINWGKAAFAAVPFAFLGLYLRYVARGGLGSITSNPDDIRNIQITISYNDREPKVIQLYPVANNDFAINAPNGEVVAFNAMGERLAQLMNDAPTGRGVPLTVHMNAYPKDGLARVLTGFFGLRITLPNDPGTTTMGKRLWSDFLAPRLRITPYQQLCDVVEAQHKELVEYTITIAKRHDTFSLAAPLGFIATSAAGLLSPALMPLTAAGSIFLTAKYPLNVIPRPRCFGDSTVTSFTANTIGQAKQKFVAWAQTERTPGEVFSVSISARLKSGNPMAGAIRSSLISNEATYNVEKFYIRLNDGNPTNPPHIRSVLDYTVIPAARATRRLIGALAQRVPQLPERVRVPERVHEAARVAGEWIQHHAQALRPEAANVLYGRKLFVEQLFDREIKPKLLLRAADDNLL